MFPVASTGFVLFTPSHMMLLHFTNKGVMDLKLPILQSDLHHVKPQVIAESSTLCLDNELRKPTSIYVQPL